MSTNYTGIAELPSSCNRLEREPRASGTWAYPAIQAVRRTLVPPGGNPPWRRCPPAGHPPGFRAAVRAERLSPPADVRAERPRRAPALARRRPRRASPTSACARPPAGASLLLMHGYSLNTQNFVKKIYIHSIQHVYICIKSKK